MQKIGTKADCDNLKGLPRPVHQRIEETVAILNYHYGENRHIDKDLGGYVLIVEKEEDFLEFKKIFSEEISRITVEYADIIFWKGKPTHTASLFLISSDFSIFLIIPYSLTPASFLANATHGKEG